MLYIKNGEKRKFIILVFTQLQLASKKKRVSKIRNPCFPSSGPQAYTLYGRVGCIGVFFIVQNICVCPSRRKKQTDIYCRCVVELGWCARSWSLARSLPSGVGLDGVWCGVWWGGNGSGSGSGIGGGGGAGGGGGGWGGSGGWERERELEWEWGVGGDGGCRWDAGGVALR